MKCVYVLGNSGDNMSSVAGKRYANTTRSQNVYEVVCEAKRTARTDSIPAILRRYRLHRLITTLAAPLQRLEVHSVLLDRRCLRHRTADEEASSWSGVCGYWKTLHVEGRCSDKAV